MDWFHDLPATPLAFVVVVAVLAGSMAGLALFAGLARRINARAQLDNSAIAGLLAALVGIYSIAAGLTAVAVWNNTVDATAHVSREVTAITVLYHDLGGYPKSLEAQARARLTQYTRDVIEKEWPVHQRGSNLDGGLEVLEDLQHMLYAFEPTTEGQKVVHAETLHSYNRLVEMRRERIRSADETALPGPLWAVVTLLGAIAITSCFLLRIDSLLLHATVTALVATPIALVVFFIAVTDRPFRGGVTVSVEPYREALAHLTHHDAPGMGGAAAPRQ